MKKTASSETSFCFLYERLLQKLLLYLLFLLPAPSTSPRRNEHHLVPQPREQQLQGRLLLPRRQRREGQGGVVRSGSAACRRRCFCFCCCCCPSRYLLLLRRRRHPPIPHVPQRSQHDGPCLPPETPCRLSLPLRRSRLSPCRAKPPTASRELGLCPCGRGVESRALPCDLFAVLFLRRSESGAESCGLCFCLGGSAGLWWFV